MPLPDSLLPTLEKYNDRYRTQQQSSGLSPGAQEFGATVFYDENEIAHSNVSIAPTSSYLLRRAFSRPERPRESRTEGHTTLANNDFLCLLLALKF